MKHKYLVLIFFIFFYLNSCKKNSQAPNSSVSIVGKWFVTSHKSKIYQNGIKLDSTFKTNFTTEDFIQYFSDGTGITSSTNSPSPSLSAFKYTINGSNLTQFNSGGAGVLETITELTADNLSIHYTLLVTDPNNGSTDNETDDYNLSK